MGTARADTDSRAVLDERALSRRPADQMPGKDSIYTPSSTIPTTIPATTTPPTTTPPADSPDGPPADIDDPTTRGDDVVAFLDGASSVPDKAVAGDVIPNRFIVTFSDSGAASAGARTIRSLGGSAATDGSAKSVVTDSAGLAALEAVEGVKTVEPDRVVSADVTQPAAPWAIDRIDRQRLQLLAGPGTVGDHGRRNRFGRQPCLVLELRHLCRHVCAGRCRCLGLVHV